MSLFCYLRYHSGHDSICLLCRQRSFDYSAAKLLAAMEWRREYGAAAVTAADVARAMAPGHMYWAGEDRFRRPILYVRCVRARCAGARSHPARKCADADSHRAVGPDRKRIRDVPAATFSNSLIDAIDVFLIDVTSQRAQASLRAPLILPLSFPFSLLASFSLVRPPLLHRRLLPHLLLLLRPSGGR